MMKYILWAVAGLIVLGSVYTVIGGQTTKSNSEATKASTETNLQNGSYKVALFAGGCFWSLESYFEKAPDGIIDAVSGYSGGKSDNPTYQNYAEEGHREVVQVIYDPKKISYGELTEYYFRHIDPTDAGGSFFDRGENYTSAIYYENEDEKKVAEDVITIIDANDILEKPIVTEVLPKATFWPAEEYHQNYAKNNELQYVSYRVGSGRDAFLQKTWQGKENVLYKK
ncbi:MAG: peptide-methionine (S)-S-oxide reductase MsrA [Candidatus Levybacteria bacterium]|nr:peptide-methionine (S)-S-oxide reductase MsrA [Candidatus Levybacteria bacterium]